MSKQFTNIKYIEFHVKGLKSTLEYKILMKSLFVLNFVFICCVRSHQHCLYVDGEDGHHGGRNM